MHKKKPELLAPAGSFEALQAAVACGADAVYLGGSSFSARAYAKNFDGDQMKQALDYCHARGVRVYVAINTLLLDKEMERALDETERLYRMGADALIVQDVGYASAVKQCFPDLPLHASTQMAVHNAAGVRAVEALGMERAVLAREVSLEGIRRIRNECDLPLEVFVGGAMCSSVSGLCLFSSLVVDEAATAAPAPSPAA